ncbi:MAG TPA: alpha/beta hydrolase-fold protein [Prosthecobacter sp.]|nr:alpha/beta hydrolase-fold protein [Prosthecobacter sp.]
MPFRTIEISNPAETPEGVHFVTVKSAALKRRADIALYVPRGIRAAKLPLVILLHGVYGSHWAWLFKGAAHRVLDRLIRDEGLPPMMLAMPSDGLWGDGSGYVRHADADYARWIIDEVPAAAALVEPDCARAARFIGGLSMGGYGALWLGALHGDQFSAISAHSSITDVMQMQGFVEETAEQFVLAEGRPLSVLACIKVNAARLPPLRFDCGSDDELIEHNRTLHRELTAAGISHTYTEFPGAHTWEYWHEHLADSLRFFGAQLAAD